PHPTAPSLEFQRWRRLSTAAQDNRGTPDRNPLPTLDSQEHASPESQSAKHTAPDRPAEAPLLRTAQRRSTQNGKIVACGETECFTMAEPLMDMHPLPPPSSERKPAAPDPAAVAISIPPQTPPALRFSGIERVHGIMRWLAYLAFAALAYSILGIVLLWVPFLQHAPLWRSFVIESIRTIA